ncbi:MAG: TldE/PmbA family protein [Proteobacteria bacterium]|jgi:predicted Zn-dependent protease|nr:TldE/PmbA family protein [Pseudomonadota bacterium]
MEAFFGEVAGAVDAALASGERHASSFSAEETDFVRMNRGKVRQPGHVEQRYLRIRLIRGARHASHTLSLSGDLAHDRPAIGDAVKGLRAALTHVEDDPYLLLPSVVASSRAVRGGGLPAAGAMVERLLDAATGHDLVGILATGPVYRGFCNSEGQRNWHAGTTFNLQWSLYHRADKAVKSSWAGFEWSDAELTARMAGAIENLALIARPVKTLTPGAYRAFLTPAAMQEVAGLLCWGGFSGRALATEQSPLGRMKGDARLDQRVGIAEDIEDGVAPAFQGEGFVRPARVPLIEGGRLVGAMVSPRTAREFALAENGANGSESPEALAMEPGALAQRDAIAALDTGLAIGNLWYLNYSDRPACRMTGMTRFATFWVEHGKVVAPVDVMRFDDTIYRMLGSHLEALTAERELILDSDTYGGRSLASVSLPGALLSAMQFTL